jgi:hypothetical protein
MNQFSFFFFFALLALFLQPFSSYSDPVNRDILRNKPVKQVNLFDFAERVEEGSANPDANNVFSFNVPGSSPGNCVGVNMNLYKNATNDTTCSAASRCKSNIVFMGCVHAPRLGGTFTISSNTLYTILQDNGSACAPGFIACALMADNASGADFTARAVGCTLGNNSCDKTSATVGSIALNYVGACGTDCSN